jgi:hypothetical protein
MARVYGLRCEACGKLDIGSAEEFLYQDQFPRAGWISVTLWIDDAVAGPEHTICSQQCLNFFSFMAEDLSQDEEEEEEIEVEVEEVEEKMEETDPCSYSCCSYPYPSPY